MHESIQDFYIGLPTVAQHLLTVKLDKSQVQFYCLKGYPFDRVSGLKKHLDQYRSAKYVSYVFLLNTPLSR